MKDNLVSIIIPVFNVEKWILRCLNSILEQTYTNFECICVDDGSTDRSGAICEEFQKKDNRIKVLHTLNGGVSKARNTGILEAKGQYILFIDSDDWIAPNHVERILPIQNEDVVYSGYRQYNKGVLTSKHMPPSKVCSIDEIKKDFVNLQRRYLIYYVWSACYKTEILKNNAIKFDETVALGEDILFNISYLKHSKIVRLAHLDTYCHDGVGPESLVHRYWPDRCEKEKHECQMVENFIGHNDYSLRWFNWHMALWHLEIWTQRGKVDAQQKLIDAYCEPYFRESIPYMRKHGTLDEKFETFFMHSTTHALFKPAYNVVLTLHKLKKNFTK